MISKVSENILEVVNGYDALSLYLLVVAVRVCEVTQHVLRQVHRLFSFLIVKVANLRCDACASMSLLQ